jgi:transcriptional regulator with XRE-family HTH domain
MFPDKSTAEIAKIIGCRKQAVYNWEHGITPTGMFLQRLAFLGADIDWILTGRRKDT